jgi:arginyl-tRNA synthetase
MKTVHSKLKNDLSSLLKNGLEEAFDQINTDKDQIAKSLTAPPQTDLGDYSFPCFPYAKELKKSPAQIAQALEEVIELPNFLSKISAMGPYLNITFKTTWLRDQILGDIEKEIFFKQDLFLDTPKLVIEYSQPNTHKELHVGHMRNLCLGNALIKMLRYANHDVVSCTFPGDVGTHVAKCLWYLKFHNQEPVPEDNKGAWLGRMYSLAHNKLENEKNTPQEDKNRSELTEILKQIEKNQGEFYDLWLETRQWSIELFNKVYSWANVSFDRWYWESEVDSSSLKFAQELYEQGKLTKDQGAI